MKIIKRRIFYIVVALIFFLLLGAENETWAKKKKKKTKTLSAEYLPPKDAETVKQFLKKNKLKFKKKLVNVKLAIVLQQNPNPQSIVKLFPVSRDPVSVKAFWSALMLGYRISVKESEKIGEIEYEFADDKTLTVFITNKYFYIRHGEDILPFYSLALKQMINLYIKTPKHIKSKTSR